VTIWPSFADVITDALQALPPWVWVLALIGFGLSIALLVAGQKGLLISGREFDRMVKSKDEEIAELKVELTSVRARSQADREAMTDLFLAGQSVKVAAGRMLEEAARDERADDPYAARLDSRRGSAGRGGSQGSGG
jgi:hypothetical protein